MRIAITAVGMALACVAGSVLAQGADKKFSVSVDGGFGMTSWGEVPSVTNSTQGGVPAMKMDNVNQVVWRVALGYQATPNHGFELALSKANEVTKNIMGITPNATSGDVSYALGYTFNRSTRLELSYVYSFTEQLKGAILQVGATSQEPSMSYVYRYEQGSSSGHGSGFSSHGSMLGIVLGAGYKMRIMDNMDFRAMYRMYMDRAFVGSRGVQVPSTFTHAVTGGLVFRF